MWAKTKNIEDKMPDITNSVLTYYAEINEVKR